MGAIVKACSVNVTVGNTGKECDTAMAATAMLIALHSTVKFDDQDLADPVPWMQELIHKRVAFPIFGQEAPIRTITNNAESDVLVTLDDGLQVFLRYGVYNRIFETTSGGFCYAKSLQSFNKSGYRILELDQTGQMLARKNSDGTYSGFITDFMYAPSPIWADFKNTPYKNRFQISYSPVEVVNNGIIFQGAEELLSMMGLIDVELVLVGTPTTTTIKVNVRTECAGTDLVTLYGTKLAEPGMFVVRDDTGAAIATVQTVDETNKLVTLSGTYISGKVYTVAGGSPEIWYAEDVDGYDASTAGMLNVTIP